MKRDDYRKLTGYVPQQPVIFTDSIINNIVMGEEPDQANLEYAMKISQLDKEMVKFGLGPQTIGGPKGKTLSG